MSPKNSDSAAARAASRQLEAYNRGDVDAFVACFHPDVELFELQSGEPRGKQGREGMRETYGALFARCPDLHAEVTVRSVVGNVAFDREVVTGLREGEVVHAMAIYEVDEDELIRRVWFVLE